MNNTRIATTLLAASIALIGCGEEKPAPKPEAKGEAAPAALEIKIGHAAPLTGGIAHLGKDNENGARLAIDEANAASITIDGKQARFVLVAEDDQADPKVGTTVAQKLVDARVNGVVGHLNSGVSIPASSVYNRVGDRVSVRLGEPRSTQVARVLPTVAESRALSIEPAGARVADRLGTGPQ